MASYGTREELREKIIRAFAVRDEVYQISFFGKEARGKSDRYSDIDAVVCSSDLARTQAEYLNVFDAISPVRATFPLGGDTDGFAEMILLRDYSPYQKVDFSVHRDISEKAWAGPFLVAYKDEGKKRTSPTKLAEVNTQQDVAYKLNDVLFSVARFTKCLFRQDIDMYRRWSSITSVTLVMLYEKHLGWEAETTKKRLRGFETERLYNALEPHEKRQIDAIFPPKAGVDLALSYRTSIDLFIRLSKQKAENLGIALDLEFIEYIQGFLDSEMARYQRQRPS